MADRDYTKVTGVVMLACGCQKVYSKPLPEAGDEIYCTKHRVATYVQEVPKRVSSKVRGLPV